MLEYKETRSKLSRLEVEAQLAQVSREITTYHRAAIISAPLLAMVVELVMGIIAAKRG